MRGGGHLGSERRHAVHDLLLVSHQRHAERRQFLNGDARGRVQGGHPGPLEALRVPRHLDRAQPLADRGQLCQVHRVRRQWIRAPVENTALDDFHLGPPVLPPGGGAKVLGRGAMGENQRPVSSRSRIYRSFGSISKEGGRKNAGASPISKRLSFLYSV